MSSKTGGVYKSLGYGIKQLSVLTSEQITSLNSDIELILYQNDKTK